MGKFTETAMEAYRQTMTDGRLMTIKDCFESIEAALIQFGMIGKVAGSISASSGGVANVTYADAENPRAEHVGPRPGLGAFECVMQPDGSIASRPHVRNQETFAIHRTSAKYDATKPDRHGNHAMLAKMDPAEPFFVLRGQDALAATLVRDWADRAEAAGVPRDKIDNARQCARAMKNWPMKKIPD